MVFNVAFKFCLRYFLYFIENFMRCLDIISRSYISERANDNSHEQRHGNWDDIISSSKIIEG